MLLFFFIPQVFDPFVELLRLNLLFQRFELRTNPEVGIPHFADLIIPQMDLGPLQLTLFGEINNFILFFSFYDYQFFNFHGLFFIGMPQFLNFCFELFDFLLKFYHGLSLAVSHLFDGLFIIREGEL